MEHIVMASDVGESFLLLDTVLAGEEGGAFTREEVLDALAFLALDATLSTGELPTDPILIKCLEDWRSRVLSATSDEPDLEFPQRIARYFELRPINPRVIAALETHFDRKDAKQENRTRSRAEKLLGTTIARFEPAAPKKGSSLLAIRSSGRSLP